MLPFPVCAAASAPTGPAIDAGIAVTLVDEVPTTPFVAATVTVKTVPFTMATPPNVVTVLVVIGPVTVWFSVVTPSVIVRIEPVIDVPPSDVGGVQETVNCPSLADALTFCGADGPPTGLEETVEYGELPTTLWAAMRKM